MLEAVVSLPALSGTIHMESDPEHKWKLLATSLLYRRVLPEKPAVDQQCPHPADSVVNGANQKGSWRRCLLCQTKISYGPHRAKPKQKAGKAGAYVSEPRRKSQLIEALGKVMAENSRQLQAAMAQCNQQVLQDRQTTR